MNDHNRIVVGILCLVLFCIPLLLGAAIYFCFRPLCLKLKHWWKFLIFWCVLVWILAVILLIEKWTHFFGVDFYAYYLGVKGHLQVYLTTLGLPFRVSNWVSTYLLVSLPLSPLFGGIVLPLLFKSRKKDQLGADDFKKDAHFSPEVFNQHREKGEGAFLGMDRENKKPVYVSEHEMGMHTQVIGATGFGKTMSVLIPLLNYNLSHGLGTVIIDGKAENDFLIKLKALVKQYGREKDFEMFSTVHFDQSDYYNPIRNGSPADIKDKLIGSQIWSEEFYKKKGEQLLLLILNVFEDQDIIPTFRKIEMAISNPKSFRLRPFKRIRLKEKWDFYRDNHAKNSHNYEGIAADISLISDDSTFGELFDTETAGINLFDAYKKNKIIYFHLPVLKNEETVKRIGRLIIHDLKDLCAAVHTTPDFKPHFFPVYIDEFASFAFPSFIELLNKSRSAGVAFTMLHQSLGDIGDVSPSYAKQITENTNIKIILRVDDPETIETQCRMVGTKRTLKYTYQTEKLLLNRVRSGGASLREVDEYIVDPNEFRNLQIGNGIIIVKGSRRVHRVKFDYLQIPQKCIEMAKEWERLPQKEPPQDENLLFPSPPEASAKELFV